jgi:hypothetical protein
MDDNTISGPHLRVHAHATVTVWRASTPARAEWRFCLSTRLEGKSCSVCVRGYSELYTTFPFPCRLAADVLGDLVPLLGRRDGRGGLGGHRGGLGGHHARGAEPASLRRTNTTPRERQTPLSSCHSQRAVSRRIKARKIFLFLIFRFGVGFAVWEEVCARGGGDEGRGPGGRGPQPGSRTDEAWWYIRAGTGVRTE